jgi:electron transfer flavoprotein alpha/beta subunit
LLQKWPEFDSQEALDQYLAEHNLKITVWTAADLDLDETQIGLAGSPTQVYKVNYVVLEAAESKEVPPTAEGIHALIEELVREYIVG